MTGSGELAKQFTVVRASALSGQSMALVAESDLVGVPCPTVAMVQYGSHRVRVWVYYEQQAVDSKGAAQPIAPGTVGLTDATLHRLEASIGQEILLIFSPVETVVVRAARVEDLPMGATIQVAAEVVSALAGPTAKWVWVNAICDSRVVASVRLVARTELKLGQARVSMVMRILLGVTAGEQIHLTRLFSYTKDERRRMLWRRVSRRRQKQRQGGWLTTLAGLVILTIRRLDLGLEEVLRFFLGAPSIALRTTQAHPGDDTFDVIKLNLSLFATLGISPGDHVLVSWGMARKALAAFEDHLPHGTPVPGSVVAGQMVDRIGTGVDQGFPAQLVARVPAVVRMELGMPPSSVVEIRRRLRPIVWKHLNVLTVPVAGLILAAVAIPDVRGWPLVLGSVIPVVFGMASLRVAVSPKGPWP